MPASATSSATARASDSRSPRIGQARNATQTGIEIPMTAASLALSHNSASPMKATQLPIVSNDTSTSRSRMPVGTSRRCRRASAISGQRRRAGDAAEPARGERRPLRQQMLHDRKVEAPADRGDREEDKAERRYPGAARLGNNSHGGRGSIRQWMGELACQAGTQ